MCIKKKGKCCVFISAALDECGETSLTAVKDSQMKSGARLSHGDRLAEGAAAATLRWTKTQYDKQTQLQPEQTEIK